MRYTNFMEPTTRPTSFRLSTETRRALAALAKDLRLSQTAVLVMLIHDIGPIVAEVARDQQHHVRQRLTQDTP